MHLLLWSSHAVGLLYHHAVVQNASCAMYAAAHDLLSLCLALNFDIDLEL